MRRSLLILAGWFAIVIGLVWMGQGSGYFPYPEQSFMIDQSPWIYYGLLLSIAGGVMIVLARRKG